MKAIISNFGKVTSANVKLDGITVIAGSNGSGKSTISRVLMTWISYLRQVKSRIAEERVKSIVEAIGKILADANLPMLFIPSSVALRNQRKLLDSNFWQNRKEATEWIVGRMLSLEVRHKLDEMKQDLHKAVDKLHGPIVAAVDKIFKTPDDPYEFFVANTFFRRSFDDQVGTFFDMAAEASVCLEMDDGILKEAKFMFGKCTYVGDVSGNHVIPTFYIEPRHLIDSYVDARFSQPKTRSNRLPDNRFSCGEELGWKRILFNNPDLDLWSMQRAQRQEVLNEELDKIVATIHGQIDKDERGIGFRDVDTREMISLRNVASGVKSMALLIRGLRNGIIEPGHLLIIDEPETNLHPEWQVKFAEFLVLLNAKFGIRSLLNTHSPHFLKAVRVYSDLLGIEEKCSYYTMAQEGGDGRFRAKDVTDEVEQVFADMSRPYAKLIYGESYDGKVGQPE